MILTPLQKLPNNVGNLGKIIVATGFEWLPKVQKIAQSGHTVYELFFVLSRLGIDTMALLFSGIKLLCKASYFGQLK